MALPVIATAEISTPAVAVVSRAAPATGNVISGVNFLTPAAGTGLATSSSIGAAPTASVGAAWTPMQTGVSTATHFPTMAGSVPLKTKNATGVGAGATAAAVIAGKDRNCLSCE